VASIVCSFECDLRLLNEYDHDPNLPISRSELCVG